MALTTAANVFAQAGITSPSAAQTAQASAFISGITSLVKHRLNRDIEQATYTEYYTGDGSPYIILRQYPVISVTSLYYDPDGYNGDASGAFGPTTQLFQGVDWTLTCGQYGQGSTGIIQRINQAWYGRPSRAIGTVSNLPPLAGSGNIKVTYIAGYNPVPPAIQMAVNALVVKMMTQADVGGGVQSTSYEDFSVSMMSPEDEAKVWGSISSTLGSFTSIVI